MTVIAGFDQDKTEEIATRPNTCAFCNDDKPMPVNIDEIEKC